MLIVSICITITISSNDNNRYISQYSIFKHTTKNLKKNMMQQQQQNRSNQLQRTYSKQQFIVIISNLVSQFQFHVSRTPEEMYNQLIIEKNKVIGQDIVDILQNIKEEEAIRTSLNQQLQFYHKKICQLQDKHSSSITKKHFIQLFNKYKNNGQITPQIISRIEQIQHISIKKLTKMLKKLSQKTTITIPSQIFKSSLQHSQIFLLQNQQENQQSSLIPTNPKKQFNNHISALISYINKNINDEILCEQLTKACQKITIFYQSLLQDYQQSQQSIQKLHERIMQIQINHDQDSKQYQDSLIRMDKKIQKMQDELNQKKNNNKQYMKIVYQLENQNQQLLAEKNQYYGMYVEADKQLVWIKENYKELEDQYGKYVRNMEDQIKKRGEDREERLFTQRSVKEELEDCRLKIERLRAEKNGLLDKIAGMEAVYQSETMELQQKIKDYEQQLKRWRANNQFQQVRSSYYQYRGVNDSTYSRKSRINQSKLNQSKYSQKQSIVSPIKMSKIPKISTITQHLPQNINLRKTISILTQQIQHNNNNNQPTKINKDFSKKKQNKQITYQISQFINQQTNTQYNDKDQIGILQAKQLVKIVEDNIMVLQEEDQSDKDKDGIKYDDFISCLGYIVHQSGTSFPIGMIITKEKVIILDSKFRLKYTFMISQLKKIYFCYYNWSWVVFKAKQHQYDSRNHQLIDIVVTIKNREEVGRFLQQKCLTLTNNKKVYIQFQREDSIWVKHLNKQILLSHFINVYHLFRINVQSTNDVFQAIIKEDGILNFSSDVFVVVTRVGIVAFQKDSSELLENSQKVVSIIPIVQKMNIIEFAHKKHTIKLTYQTQKKSIKIKTRSYAVTHKLKLAIQRQKQQNFARKRQQMNQLGIKSKIIISRLQTK